MSSRDHGVNPPEFGVEGLATLAVGSTLSSLAFTAQRNSPRIVSRNLRACAGVVLARRSRPAMMLAVVIFANG
jgi:hypothetical protein